MIMAKGNVVVDYTSCIGCGVCIQACPFSYLSLTKYGSDQYQRVYPELIPGNGCTGCGICAQACPLECVTCHKPEKKRKTPSYVIISDAPDMDYMQDYVSLPKNYGSPAYFQRPDVTAIRETVYTNLNQLNETINFTEQLNGRRVLIKPNLVSVYHKMGFKEEDYPESTDPRVFEAVVSYVKQYTDNIVIIESSGKGMPTRTSFKASGLDRVAAYYGIPCLALEHQPVVRYMLPKAEVMKEVLLPEILDEVVRGEAFYISVPKMKTNLYTGVTLGFKNAMGTIPYYLRERNHNYLINKKLVDLLYLFKPDLTVIDGIIGGEGCTPAPVDPVRVGVIISGNNSVETDRVATRMMGVDPEENKLMVEAVRKGFNDDQVTVIGEQKVVPFRPAEASMMDDQFKKDFPNVRVLVGHMKNNAPVITDVNQVDAETIRRMEKVCDGGCLAATKTSFEMMKYAGDVDPRFEMTVILGAGVKVDGKTYYFDRDGKPYDIESIRNLKCRRVTIGECTRDLKSFCEFNGEGCCNPSSCLMTPYAALGRRIPLMNPKNKYLFNALIESLRTYRIKRRLIKSGRWVDCPPGVGDQIFDLPELTAEQMKQDHIEWPLPVLEGALLKQRLKEIKLIV